MLGKMGETRGEKGSANKVLVYLSIGEKSRERETHLFEFLEREMGILLAHYPLNEINKVT